MFGVQAILSAFIWAAIPAPQDATLIFVTSPGCGFCQQVAPLVKEIAEMGYSVETVDASQRPDLVRDQLKVSMFPTFLMLSHDRIIDRVVGGGNPITLKARILYMFERAVELQRKNGEIIQASFVTPSPVTSSSVTPISVTSSATSGNPATPILTTGLKTESKFDLKTVPKTVENTAKNPVTISTWITSSVKLRVDADNTHSWGTGTIIDTRKGEALILTCGHIFRDSQGKGKIEVHLFGQNSTVRVFGRCLHYDLEIDLALVIIVPPCPVRAIPIAPQQYQILPKQRVLSVGCDGGANPTVREHYVMSTDRVGTPRENMLPFHYIQVYGAPVSGRSGGGLFTEDGYLIGVCNTADPVQNDGHFVPPQMIRHVLQSMQLSEIYEHPSLTDHSPVPATTVTIKQAAENFATINTPTVNPATPNPALANPVTQLEPLKLEPLKLEPLKIEPLKTEPLRTEMLKAEPFKTSVQQIPVTMESETGQEMDEKQRATLDEIKRRQQDGDEVILIVRSRRNPEIPSDVIILSGTSDQFLDALVKHEPVSNNTSASSYNPVIFSSHETLNPNLRPLNSPSVPIADRQPVSFPVLH